MGTGAVAEWFEWVKIVFLCAGGLVARWPPAVT
jgi:hypothetical protein